MFDKLIQGLKGYLLVFLVTAIAFIFVFQFGGNQAQGAQAAARRPPYASAHGISLKESFAPHERFPPGSACR